MPTENASITTPLTLDPDKKCFTVAQANSALPYVSRVVEDITQVYARIIELRRGADRPEGPEPDTEKEYEKTMDRLSELVDELHAVGVELKDFDLAARTIILKMQPRLREELLQGLREEGPEGYRKFIRNYYLRLTKVQSKPGKK